ncbi:MAG: sulfurtransferase [Burkholderiales bacterium]|nr:sulfurtransferase [Burkholderiales bacterium]
MAQDSSHSEYLVSTEWLAEHLGDPGIVVLDGTTHLMPPPPMPYRVVAGRADFEQGHIPGARFVDIDAELSDPAQPPGLHFTVPSPELFAATMGRLGVGDDTRVVTYATANHWWATRLWWMLRAFGHTNTVVLDGGFQLWQKEGRPIETGPARPVAPSVFTARYQPEMVATKHDVLAAIGQGDVCTLNALRAEQHAGTGGTFYGRPGHIKGSVNVPAVDLVDADNRFRPLAELRTMLAGPLAKPEVIAYCGGGIAATSATLALTMLGHRKVRLYDASMSEWAVDPTLPMETGA